ncbi:hypothetical protein BHM03_00042198 [Ensete ventricosum]|nr:hypothetical protein BHM03_00042198 [Ensete ventricosum]
MVVAKMCSLLVQDVGSKEGRDSGYGEMAVVGNSLCRGGIGYGCVAVTRAASSGDGLRGYVEEEQRVMATGVVASYSGMGEKEAEEATTMTEVAGKRRQQPMMGGSGSRRPELAAAAVKKADGWLWLRVDCGSGK